RLADEPPRPQGHAHLRRRPEGAPEDVDGDAHRRAVHLPRALADDPSLENQGYEGGRRKRRSAVASERRERATRPARAGEAASEDACRRVRGAKPLGKKTW